MPKERMKSKARGRKRKASLPLESEEAARSESKPHSAVKNTVLAATNGGKYVPRFGSAAKKQRMDSEAKKLNRDTSEEEEQVLYPISCTQPAGSARGDPSESEEEGEWSSTQPASRILSSTSIKGLDVQERQVTDSLTKLLHEIPTDNETKDDTESATVNIPGLALSQSLPPSPHPVCPCDNENKDSTVDHMNSVDETLLLDVEDNQTHTCTRSENAINADDDKCLNLLNPFSLDTEEETSCTRGERVCHGQPPHTNSALAAGAMNPAISCPTIPTSTHATDSHRNADYYNGMHAQLQQGYSCVAEEDAATGVLLPNSRLAELAIHQEPIEESFYSSTPSQKKEKQSTLSCLEDDSDSSPPQNKDIQSSGVEVGGGSPIPLNDSTDDVEALKELEDLGVDDLEEGSQLVVSASLSAIDQTAPSTSTHVQLLTPHSATEFVAGHAQRRRPSSESQQQQQQSSQEMSLKEGTQIMHGLIQELSALNRFILHCKRELETAFRQQRSSRHMPHHRKQHQHQHPPNLPRNYPTHTQR